MIGGALMAVVAAGWKPANGCQMLVEQSACEFAPGRVGKVRGDAPVVLARGT